MTESYENRSIYQRLSELCRSRNMAIDPEPGNRISFRGQSYIVAAAQGDALALMDDLCGVPPQPNQFIVVREWENDPNCFLLPSLEQLLEIVYRRSNLFPIVTPGVKDTRPVWQVSHPSSPPIVRSTLERGLLDLAVRVLEKDCLMGPSNAVPAPGIMGVDRSDA